MIGSSPLYIIETNELLPPPPQESNQIKDIAEDVVGGGFITIGVTALVAGGPVTWAALAIGVGCFLCLDAAGVFDDPKNPQAWIKGGVSISLSAIPGFGAAKGITTISKVPWTLIKDGAVFSGGKWAASTGIHGLPKGIGTSVTWDFGLNNIMDYLGIPKHIY
ncbi:hypothetical protein [Methanobacterium petrolearium]|uniref:hypothetical protein n=1 Tax=Methanobacterium petrolearium TaxID=710190 RepID=UPI001AE4066D|nr:hypothetical protein [Methanobacterium petrolearium]MBP1946516.1 hypothetical protein [Methanobacterium petrolearium]BDZ69858.1 hypothetical protein GCM10025861_03750 [Methanobacterium petrolearium]